jgi:mannose-6-phosphate isomerase-like protein (cupin superfamily)
MSECFQGLPAGVGLSYLEVYESESPDGIRGGSAHVHLTCTEAYVVIGGSGRLQTLSSNGFEDIELHPRQVVWFTPGVVHRLVNGGDLDIIIVMQNGGLPESGDCILSFPDEYLKDRASYRAAVELPPIEAGRDAVDAAAKRRKDLSITGFVALREAMERDGFAALEVFYRDAAALVAGDRGRWHEVWQGGAVRATETTGSRLEALARGDLGYLEQGALRVTEVRAGSPRAGMCGRITSFDVPDPRP